MACQVADYRRILRPHLRSCLHASAFFPTQIVGVSNCTVPKKWANKDALQLRQGHAIEARLGPLAAPWLKCDAMGYRNLSHVTYLEVDTAAPMTQHLQAMAYCAKALCRLLCR